MPTGTMYALLQAPIARDGLSVAADVAMIVVGVSILITALVAIISMRKATRALDEVRTGVRQNLGPVSDRARSISDNVEFISSALRTDVERLNASVRALSDRLHQASDRMEERIEEFNALMEVVQGEAEGIFLDTAATVRGVREGAKSIGRPPAPPRPADDAEAAATEADHPPEDEPTPEALPAAEG